MSYLTFPVFGGDARGKLSATAGTAIAMLVWPRRGAWTRLMKLIYRNAGTLHTVTVLRSLGRTTVNGAAAASQAVVNITANPGPSGNAMAANDWVVIRYPDGTFDLDTVSSISTLAVTLTNNLGQALVGGESFWNFGIPADTDPITGLAHQAFLQVISTDTTNSEETAGIARSNGLDEPLLIHSNNAAAAGTILQATWLHTTN